MRSGSKKGVNGNGSIRKKTIQRNGKSYTYWEGRYTECIDPCTGKQTQRSVTGKSQAEVAKKLKQITLDLEQKTYIHTQKMSIEQWLNIWKTEYMGDIKESTAYLYGQCIDTYIIPYIGSVQLANLTAASVQSLYNRLVKSTEQGGNGLSPKTLKNVHGILHKALQQAVLNGMIRKNPTEACKLPRVVKSEVEPLDEDEIVTFLKAIRGHQHELIYKVTMFTGLREGEVLGLTWDCIDFEKEKLTVKKQLRKEQKKGGTYYFSTPKNGKVRVLALAPSVVEMFRQQKERQKAMRIKAGSAWEEKGLVFTNEAGNYLSYRTVYDCFKRIVKKIGCPKKRFHDLRHTYAVMAIKNGDDIKTVQENLGHATASFTLDVYGHITEQMRKDSAERMENLIQKMS